MISEKITFLVCDLFSKFVLPSGHFCFVRWWLKLFVQCMALLVIFDDNSYLSHLRLICFLGWIDLTFWFWDNIVITM